MELTFNQTTANLASTSPHVECGIGLSETNGVSRIFAVFLCAKSQFIIMLDWVRQSKDWLDSFVPVDQPCSVRHHDWSHDVGFKTLQTEAIMPKSHTQKLTTHVSEKSKSRFNVISKTGRSIARKVPFSTAIRLKNAQPEFTIKFDSMVGAGGEL